MIVGELYYVRLLNEQGQFAPEVVLAQIADLTERTVEINVGGTHVRYRKVDVDFVEKKWSVPSKNFFDKFSVGSSVYGNTQTD